MKALEATDANFETEVLNADLPVLVDFWAVWCGPCKMIAPVVEEIAKDYTGKLIVAKVDVDENPMSGQKYGVRSIPTLLLFKNGKVVETIIGAMPKPKLLDRIKPHLV